MDRHDRPLRIGIDVSSAAKAVRTGVGRYITRLIAALADLDGGNRFDLLYRLSRWKRRRYFLRAPRPVFRTGLLVERLPFGYARRIDVFHGPDTRLPRRKPAPLVASVHDTFSADSDAFASVRFRARKIRQYLDAARRAEVVITFSEYTRTRFLTHTGADPAKVRVIPHGVESRFAAAGPDRVDAVRRRYGIDRPYLFYVGQLSLRKNLVGVLEAFARVEPGPLLVVAGPRSHGAEAIDAVHRRLGLGDRVRFLGPVPDGDLPALYTGARAHLLLSFDEGFGLPVLEAFMAGTPVLASNRGALPEVAGDAAVLVDPADVVAVAEAMQRLAEDQALRATLRNEGRARARRFSWRKAAACTLEVYREAAREA